MVADILEKKSVQRYTLEEYFELEEKAAFKSEFRNGKIVKMAGGTYEHGVIHLAISSLLFMISMQRKDLQVFNSDQKIYLPKYNHSVFADTSALIGKREMYKGGNQALLNPMIIFEVLSNSTENYDKRGKFRKYQSIPSFQEYVLIEQEMPIIDVLTKKEDGWLMKTYIGLEEEIYLKSIDVTLKMADIYSKVENLKDPQSVFEFDED
jgi:Uma2 family endonuclease